MQILDFILCSSRLGLFMLYGFLSNKLYCKKKIFYNNNTEELAKIELETQLILKEIKDNRNELLQSFRNERKPLNKGSGKKDQK